MVYDDTQGMIAGRLWLLLRWLGHDRVALLDGGLQAWLAAGKPLTQALPVLRPATFVARQDDCVVDAAYVQSFLATSRMHLVDARSADRFRGENETLDPVGGHIPGAVNRFFRDNLQADGCFKSPAELRAEWLAVLAGSPPEQVVHLCGSGVSACLAHAGDGDCRLARVALVRRFVERMVRGSRTTGGVIRQTFRVSDTSLSQVNAIL